MSNNTTLEKANQLEKKTMYLSKVEVKNFRSLQNVTANFGPGLNVIVGRNNTGKSNLIDAIRYAIGPSGARGDSLWITRDDFFKSSAASKSAETISITLTFECMSDAQRAHFFEIVDFKISSLTESKAILHFEASWPEGKRHASVQRWGGSASVDRTQVPSEILESLPVTFLPALRDAEASLSPGMKSRLALLLKDLADRSGQPTKDKIKSIFKQANDDLEKETLIVEVIKSLKTTTKLIAGSDYAPSSIRATPYEIDRILRTLQVQMEDMPIEDISSNGLGYNNLLYIAVILEHLRSPNENECPLLLVEEPEAHLHPQLTTLLADYLAQVVPGTTAPLTIITTHSPTLAASVPPSRVNVLFTDSKTKSPHCNSIVNADMDPTEEMALQRMMDITKATLYFAKGLILVEGISESLLFPSFARHCGYDLAKLHISVIPICGVAFETFKKLFQRDVLGIPVAIVTDADPPVTRGSTWEDDSPERENENYKLSDRTKSLLEIFRDHTTVKICPSQITLEYDCAEAGDNNALIMAQVWEECFKKSPRTFNTSCLNGIDHRNEKALRVWRGICRASHSGSKAEFAQRLALRLNKGGPNEESLVTFEIPKYIKDALEFVIEKLDSNLSSLENNKI